MRSAAEALALATTVIFVAGAFACGSRVAPPPSGVVVVPVASAKPARTSISPPPSSSSAPIVTSDATTKRVDTPLARAFREQLVQSFGGAPEPEAAQFRQAWEAESSGDLTSARRLYFEIIQKAPSSAIVPYAYLAFAEMFFTDAEGGAPDRIAMARQAYEQVLRYPPPANLAYAYAWHRMGLTHANAGDDAKALDAQRKALVTIGQHATLPLADEVAGAARTALVTSFANAGSPDSAYAFFRAIDPKPAGAMLSFLGLEYVRRGKAREVVAMYDPAIAAMPPKSDEICAGAVNAVRSLIGRDRNSKDDAMLARFDAKVRAKCAIP